MKNLDKWNQYYNAREPHNEDLPSPWQDELNEFQRMIILRVIRPDKVSVTGSQDHPTRHGQCNGVTGSFY